MASYLDDQRRNIIPLWRSYGDTALANELAFSGYRLLPVRFGRFDNYVEQWRAKQSVNAATDLINAAIISDQQHLPDVEKAAELICANDNLCSPIAVNLASAMLERPTQTVNLPSPQETEFDTKARLLIDSLKEQDQVTEAQIGLLRRQLHEYCNNPIAYCDLARCHANMGMNDKARKEMLCAVQLAPHSRYVTRSAARFFVHIGEPDMAKKILMGNGWVKSDPWIMAAEIAVESVMERSSKLIKTGRALVFSGNVSAFSSSELCFAICKEDWKAGKRKDGRKMFSKGMLAPNDNCLAQAEFFAKDDANLRLDFAQYDQIVRKSEADTRSFYSSGLYGQAFLSAMEWMKDYRFSHEPKAFAFHISCIYLKKYNYAVDVAKHWLKYYPDDFTMINDVAYALGLDNKIEEAEHYLAQVSLEKQLRTEPNNAICLIATYGLLRYRKGEIEEGRKLYNSAIDIAKRLKKDELATKARLNMIREEVRGVKNYDDSLLNEMEKLTLSSKSETMRLRKDIIEEVEKKKNKKD